MYASQVLIRVLKRKANMDVVPYSMVPDATVTTDSFEGVVLNKGLTADSISNSTSTNASTAETALMTEIVDPQTLVPTLAHTAGVVHDAMNTEESSPSGVGTELTGAIETTVVQEKACEESVVGSDEGAADMMDLTLPFVDATSLDVCKEPGTGTEVATEPAFGTETTTIASDDVGAAIPLDLTIAANAEIKDTTPTSTVQQNVSAGPVIGTETTIEMQDAHG